jgi:hypothetical protein
MYMNKVGIRSRLQPKISLLGSLALAILLALVSSPLAHAGNPKPAKRIPPPDPRILISDVNVAQNQLTIVYKRNGTTHVYAVDGLTRISVFGKPGTLKDITVGLQVKDYVERGGNALDGITVEKASPAPK